MTLSKLARLANVSISVVSKAFSGRDDISDSMREHVFSVARAHGCFHQFYHARYDRPVVAVIIPEVISKYYINYFEVLKKDIEEKGYTVLLSISNFDAQLTRELVRYYTEHSKVDGLILVDSTVVPSPDTGTAIISISPIDMAHFEVGIVLSLREGVRRALRALYDGGHRRIAYIGEPLTEGKRTLFIEELSALGIGDAARYAYTSHLRFEAAGADGVAALFSDPDDAPTAVLGAYGYITRGILDALADRGIRVPDDVSVISMDCDPAPLHPAYSVSYVSSSIEQLCDAALRLLSERIGTQKPNAPCTLQVCAEYVEGDTVAPIK